MKILIVNENRHNSIGGIEKYTNLLIDIFTSEGHEVSEYAFNLNPERIDMFEHNNKVIPLNRIEKKDSISMSEKRKNIKRSVKEINNIYDNYDLIINQTSNVKWPKEIYNSKKWLYVQHFNPDFYKQKYIAGKFLAPLIYFGMSITGIKNPFRKFSNFIIFTSYDYKKLSIKKSAKIWKIPLASYSIKEINSFMKTNTEKTHDLIYFGRIDNKQKNIKEMVDFANKNEIKIDFYGSGPDTKLIKGKYVNYLGTINQSKLIDILPKYKYSILLSKYEGFPFSIVESISNGVPIIINNFSPSSSFLLNGNGFYIDQFNNNSSIYDELNKNCYNFAINNLSIEKFKDNWINVLREF